MTNPTLPNADELEVRAYEWQSKGPVHFTAEPPPANMPVASCEALVRRSEASAALSSAQAQIERLSRERDARTDAEDALVDKYRDPQHGTFNFPGDVAAIVRRLESAEAEVKRLREALETVLDHVSETLGCGRHCVIEAEAKDEAEYAAAISRARSALSGGTSNDR